MDSNAVITRFKDAHKLTGTFTRVATKLGLTPTHVREVALGDRVSKRVMRALIAEVRRIDGRERAA